MIPRIGRQKARQDARTTDAVDVAEEEAARQADRANKRTGWRRRLLRALPTGLVVVALVIIIPSFVARVYAIPSGSMETTLHGCTGCNNDKVLVDKLSYRFSQPARGDIVVFSRPRNWTNSELTPSPPPANAMSRALSSAGGLLGIQRPDEMDLIKRVIAVGGQTVSCCDARNRVMVDGKPLDEPYIYFSPEFGPAQQSPFGPIRVPDGQLWVMGDSRNNSVDSRASGNGPVPLSDVIGKARLIVLPLARAGLLTAGASH